MNLGFGQVRWEFDRPFGGVNAIDPAFQRLFLDNTWRPPVAFVTRTQTTLTYNYGLIGVPSPLGRVNGVPRVQGSVQDPIQPNQHPIIIF